MGCAGVSLRNAIGSDIWELKSLGIELKTEGAGEMCVVRARAQEGEALLLKHLRC